MSVYACRDRSNGCADRVLTLLPNRCDRGAFEDCVLARRELRSTLLIGVRDVAFRGKRPGVITDRIPPEYEQGRRGESRTEGDLRWISSGCWGGSPSTGSFSVSSHRASCTSEPTASGSRISSVPTGCSKPTFGAGTLRLARRPEYFESKQENREADLYSLGLFLYQLFVGQPAFSSESAQDLARKQQIARPLEPRRGSPELGKDIEELILGLLEKDPAARARLQLFPNSARSGFPTGARRLGPMAPSNAGSRRRTGPASKAVE